MDSGGATSEDRYIIESFVREVGSRIRRGRVTIRHPEHDNELNIKRLMFRQRGRTVVTGRHGYLEIDDFHVARDGCNRELAVGLFHLARARYLKQEQEREATARRRHLDREKSGRQLRYGILTARLGRRSAKKR